MKKATFFAGALVAASSVAIPSLAAASTPSSGFTQAQQKLEQQLTNRSGQLTRLAADVTGAKSLTTAHAATLNASISAAVSSITTLATKVPTDTTWAQLKADQRTMIFDNRVYAVLTPQVFETIEADAIGAQVTTFQADEATLQTSVSSLVGQPGYKNALNHYIDFIRRVNTAAAASANVSAVVLAQTPADYPHDAHVFVNASHRLLNGDEALAHASYDVTIIGLASGGYNGS